ncbi:MAG: hypothetical protein GXP46_01735 [Deferribacteres bacterium]|nr:hypothetical protein [Deferribacteres bacterium]
MEYNWHREVIDKATRAISRHAQKLYDEGLDLSGWFSFFEKNHPEVFSKYLKIPERLNRAKAKNSMSEFKKIAKEYQDTEIWAINQFAEHLEKEKTKALEAMREKRRDPQEVLI